jgi:hypothetical protein
MSDVKRIHACLDGELSRDELTASERSELEALERVLGRAAARERERPTADLRARVLLELPAGAPQRAWLDRAAAAFGRGWSALWEPRQVSLRPLPSFALAAAVVLLVVLVGRAPSGSAPGEAVEVVATGASVEPQTILVQFRLDAPGASTVSLAGSFSEWDAAVQLEERVPGVWTVTLPLRAGVHDYLFLVDGEEWTPDPAAPRVEDDFGGVNSRILLTGRSADT